MREWNYSRRDEKLSEIQTKVNDYLVIAGISKNEQLAKQIVDNYVKVTPPEKEHHLMHMITMDHISGRNGGKSVKLGNIRLNMRNLIEAISAGVFTTLSVNDQQWAIPFAAALLWNSLWKNLEVELTSSEVVVLVTLHKVAEKKVVNLPERDLLERVNQRMDMYEMPQLSSKDLKFALKQLSAINSIDLNSDGSIFAKEWIQVKYK
ncbi:hypothetical protein [Vibrio alginolyticus]|uniref:hypothetical protein n=1 Tax=Vibrio alginolyticus TaxID=663 RepID=UPI003D7E756F